MHEKKEKVLKKNSTTEKRKYYKGIKKKNFKTQLIDRQN